MQTLPSSSQPSSSLSSIHSPSMLSVYRDVLCSRDVVNLINSCMICWACNTDSFQGYRGIQTNSSHCMVKKLKFHWDQFPRNFPVANVTGKSPTSYEKSGVSPACYKEVTRKLATFRPSRHVKMVWPRRQLPRN